MIKHGTVLKYWIFAHSMVHTVRTIAGFRAHIYNWIGAFEIKYDVPDLKNNHLPLILRQQVF